MTLTDDEVKFLLKSLDVAARLALFNRIQAAKHDNSIEQATAMLNRSREFERLRDGFRR